MSLLALLLDEDVAGFNSRRAAGQKLDLFAAELAELKLPNVDFSMANLDKADLTGTDLTGARLVKAFLSDVDGEGIILRSALAVGAKMRDAFMTGADITQADLSRAEISGANLESSKGSGVKLNEARVKGLQAAGAIWPGADFTEAQGGDVSLRGADLTNAVFTDARLPAVDLEKAKLDGARGQGAVFAKGKFAGASMCKVSLPAADFAGADLSGVDLSGAELAHANFTGANLRGAKLVDANLADVALDGADLTGADLTAADLTGVDVHALGMSEAVISALSASGGVYDPDADISFASPAVAVQPGAVAVLWLNPDAPEEPSLRWALSTVKGLQMEVLPVSGRMVLAHAVLATPRGFALLALLNRPGGESVARWELSVDGVVSPARIQRLGYEPAVVPAWRVEGEHILLWGLSRRGPSVVVHRDSGKGFELAFSDTRAQALYFLGRHWPILVNKAGILMEAISGQLGPPVRAPDGFPGKVGLAVPVAGRTVAVWLTPKVGRDPGGLRAQWLGGRLSDDVDTLTKAPEVSCLDGYPVGDRALFAWIEAPRAGAPRIFVATLPDGEPEEVPFTAGKPASVHLLPPSGPGEMPLLAVVTTQGRLAVLTADGTARASFSG